MAFFTSGQENGECFHHFLRSGVIAGGFERQEIPVEVGDGLA